MPHYEKTASRLYSFLVVMAIVFTLVWTWNAQKPTNDAQYTIGHVGISAANIQAHLAKISEFPHYTGSANHPKVRDYLVNQLEELGLEVELQTTLALSSNYFVAANVSNIIAKIPASAPSGRTKALALMSHYDAANGYSPGASDAGSGVAVILESVRAFLASGIAHSNDIYIIFTDAEEQGLLGAEAIVKGHPLADKVGLILNFEARGSGGASFVLLETNQGNKKLIDSLVDANVVYPAANSLMYSIYKMLPNDTDLTVFREQRDINGINFAFIDDHFDYHSAQDTPDRLDAASLNHQISYLSVLLPYFAKANLDQLTSNKDMVYFNFANIALYEYPFLWVLPMSILVAFVFVMMSVNAINKKHINIKSLFIATLPLCINIVFAILLGLILWHGLLWLYPQLNDIEQGFPYSGHYILATAILLTLGLSIWIYQLWSQKFRNIKIIEWYLPIIAFWVISNISIGIFLKGAGFFIILAVAPLAIFGNLLRYRTTANRKAITYTLFSLPSIVIVSPLIPVLVVGLGVANLSVATVMTSLLVMTLLPVFFVIKGIRSIQLFCLAGAFISFVGIYINADYSVDRKKPSSINYLYDTETKQAMLFSYNTQLDSFTQPFFTEDDTNTSRLKGLVSHRTSRSVNYLSSTSSLNIQPASVAVTSSVDKSDVIQLELTIKPNRPLSSIRMLSDAPIEVFALSINHQAFDFAGSKKRDNLVLHYVVTDMLPIEVKIQYRTETPSAKFRLVETSRDLPQYFAQWSPREEHIMPSVFKITDTVMISQPISQK
ncbi:M20/M25/M40 family metallo-hydrolase [Aliiglaciecola sp. 3_MG-2023]|uniref:M20/M25/M40 family metallo-hydrolase n=1 Tax=Aliiglaciecola sp. 3_MG-2023 TaxID=3062644 RepID=UPI0026E19139|nr:M20/M25/M40 family metallo-hydrolase [Aliiglaciecola sp. 3_MG-2023]MDO6693875.1 M20/M25/M40 family metallo-hydrolase [Aliiglaciecola sp. 3_MG-2023]